MPVLTGGVGVCHTYVDAAADLEKAVAIAVNAKTRNWSICNALDTLLVHAVVADAFLPRIAERWTEKGVELRCDERALAARSEGRRRRQRDRRRAGRLRPGVPGAGRGRTGRRFAGRGAGPHRRVRHRPLGRHRHGGLQRAPAASRTRSTRPSSTSTHRRSSPTAPSSASAPRSSTRPRRRSPAARSACARSRPTSGSSRATARRGREKEGLTAKDFSLLRDSDPHELQ